MLGVNKRLCVNSNLMRKKKLRRRISCLCVNYVFMRKIYVTRKVMLMRKSFTRKVLTKSFTLIQVSKISQVEVFHKLIQVREILSTTSA